MNFLSLRTKHEDSTFPSFPQREVEMVAEASGGLVERADAPDVLGVPGQRSGGALTERVTSKMNRQQRRAAERTAARGRATQPVGFQMFLTDDEITIVEEALALWGHQTRNDLSGLKLTEAQEWALGRAEKIRQGLLAAIEGRPWFDVAPQRKAPHEKSRA